MAAPKLLKASEVCELAQVQPYVLRSWEKEFPGIGVQKQAEGPRLYRPSDVDQVLRLKQLVFGEGLTLAGARRRLEDQPVPVEVEVDAPMFEEAGAAVVGADASPMFEDIVGYEVRQRIQQVRTGLKSILDLLSRHQAAPAEEFDLRPPLVREPPASVRTVTRTVRDGGSKTAGKRKRVNA